MGFLPSKGSIISKIAKFIFNNKVFAAFFSLFLPGQLMARQNYLNSNFDQYPWLYIPIFWIPPFSLVPMIMVLTGKLKKNNPKFKMTLHDLFSNVILSITTFCMIMWVPLIISLLTSDDNIGAIVDRYITNDIYAFIAKAFVEVILNSLLVFVITTFVMYLDYSKKCRKVKKGISFTQLLGEALTPTMFATSLSAIVNLLPPVKAAIEILTAVLLGSEGKLMLMIPIGIFMALAHFFGMGLTSSAKC